MSLTAFFGEIVPREAHFLFTQTNAIQYIEPLCGTYAYNKAEEYRKYLCHGRTLDENQREIFSDIGIKLWWYIEFVSRHADDTPWNGDLAYNVQLDKRKRRSFSLAQRKLAEKLGHSRTTIQKHLRILVQLGVLVIVRASRYAPSMPNQRRATVYALGPNFHGNPLSNDELFSCSHRVGHTCYKCKHTEDKNSDNQNTEQNLNNEVLKPETIEIIEARLKGNGKPLPLLGQFLSDLQIEQINSNNLPKHLKPIFTLNSRLKRKFRRVTETKEEKKARLELQHAQGAELYESVLNLVGKPGTIGEGATEDCPKGVPFYPGYRKYNRHVPWDVQEEIIHPCLNYGLTKNRIPKFNLPQMKASDPRRPKCPHRINNDSTQDTCKRSMQLALNISEGTCYWQCPRPGCSKHTLPVSLNYALDWDRRDGLGNWKQQYPRYVKKLAENVELKLNQIRKELTAERQDEVEEAIFEQNEPILRKFFDIHIRPDKEWMDIMKKFRELI